MNQFFILLIILFFSPANIFSSEIPLGLSYDDVLLIPARSSVSSRKNSSTKTRLTKKIELNIPIVSANMDTVTEAQMAITLAQLGGIGIIHRFNTIEDQALAVAKVKRHRNTIIEDPIKINIGSSLLEAKDLMNRYSISSLLVVDNDLKLKGILTSRDMLFAKSDDILISTIMTPKSKLIVGNPEMLISEAKEVLVKNKIEKLPLINEDWTLAGLITARDIRMKMEYPTATVDEKDRLRVGAAIGVQGDMLERARALIDAGADVLVLDIAHGHSELAINGIKKIKEEFPNIEIIAGNVATAKGTLELIEAGADAIKVGVGPGSICTTRIITGCGYPQLSAVMESYKVAAAYDIPIIADGGIKYSGDITKALAAGASSVMLGSLLAGTDESPGMPFIKNGKKVKIIRGMASAGAKLGRDATTKQASGIATYVPEGVEAVVPYKGKVEDIIALLIGGLRSGMSYCGCNTIEELRNYGNFVRITQAGVRESHPHDVDELIK